jgi:hypothetical protein
MSITDIVANIDQRLADLDAELTHLNRARAALINKPAAAAKATPRRAGRTSAKRTHDVVAVGKLIALLSDSAGMSTRQLSQATNGDPGQVLALLKEQEDAGQIRRTGTRAATRWHVVSDEDRIAARVAEFQATSRRARARKN